MRRPAGGWPVEADRPGIIDDVDTDTRHGGQYHNHLVQAADTAAESAVRARDGDRAAVRPVGGRSRELMGIAAVVLIFILRQALVVQNLPELDVAAMPGGARARTRQYVDAVGNDGGGVGGGGGSGGRGGGGGFDERRHVNIPASAFEKEVVERVWPPVLGHTLSAPTRRLNSAGEEDYRGRRGLPPAAYVNESQNCQRPYPDQKQCLPYFMGLSCDLCGASALATLLARHPSLAWGMRQEHDFFTRSEFSRVRLPRPPAEHEHGGAGGAGGIGAHIDALEAYEVRRSDGINSTPACVRVLHAASLPPIVIALPRPRPRLRPRPRTPPRRLARSSTRRAPPTWPSSPSEPRPCARHRGTSTRGTWTRAERFGPGGTSTPSPRSRMKGTTDRPYSVSTGRPRTLAPQVTSTTFLRVSPR